MIYIICVENNTPGVWLAAVMKHSPYFIFKERLISTNIRIFRKLVILVFYVNQYVPRGMKVLLHEGILSFAHNEES
jgi:hypothetical protein